MDDSVQTVLVIAAGVVLLYLGSWIRRRGRRPRPPGGPGPEGR
jgi:hypothetical protein